MSIKNIQDGHRKQLRLLEDCLNKANSRMRRILMSNDSEAVALLIEIRSILATALAENKSLKVEDFPALCKKIDDVLVLYD